MSPRLFFSNHNQVDQFLTSPYTLVADFGAWTEFLNDWVIDAHVLSFNSQVCVTENCLSLLIPPQCHFLKMKLAQTEAQDTFFKRSKAPNTVRMFVLCTL